MIMRNFLAWLIVGAVAATALAAEEPKTTTEKVKETASDAAEKTKDATTRAAKVVATQTRRVWNKTKAYFSDDPATYRTGATQRLHELGTEIGRLRDASGSNQRPYWPTRISALEQQQQYAMSQLSAMPEDAKRKEATRDQLDRTIEYLEDHIDIAQREMRDFAPKS
jgi:ribosomal protein L20